MVTRVGQACMGESFPYYDGIPVFFSNRVPQHILPLLRLYNAQWWGYESLTAIVLVLCGNLETKINIQTIHAET